MPRGPKPKYVIQLTTEEEVRLRKLVAARNSSQTQVVRAKIVLAAHEHSDWSNQQIAVAVGCTDRNVRKWRRRWTETKKIEDLPRPGGPRRFSP
jgi:hypothetical protein